VDGADDELVRSFRSENGQRVHLYVAYFRKQEQHREVVGAWTDRLLSAASPAQVSIAPGDAMVEVNQVTRNAAGNASRTIFWFDINGKRAIDPYRVKLYSVVDAMVHRRTNGAVVIVSWDTDAAEATADLDSQRRAFLSAVFPLLTEHLPS
jgi:EpsI family protein